MPAKKKPERPVHLADDGKAHIKTGEDPRPNLQKYGYCVVEDVMTPEECKDTINSIWNWLEGLDTGISRSDQSTWSGKHWPINMHQGMIQHTLAHEEWIWKAREHPNVLSVFSKIFGTNELLVSFDGASINRPPETGHVRSLKHSWIHSDQNLIHNIALNDFYQSNQYSVQGVVNYEVAENDDACLLIGEGSHLIHSKLFSHNNKAPKDNWYKLDQTDLDFVKQQGVIFVKVNAPAGSLILFDSRCLHSGFPHQNKRKVERFRYVSYVAMSPAKWTTTWDLQKKRKAVEEGRMTSHWSSHQIKIFPYPRTYGNPVPDYLKRKANIPDYHNWSQRRKQLAGLIPYSSSSLIIMKNKLLIKKKTFPKKKKLLMKKKIN